MLRRPCRGDQFQLTAARRRLGGQKVPSYVAELVSTHSRPKAAGGLHFCICNSSRFQLTAARRRLERDWRPFRRCLSFQLTAARRRLGPVAMLHNHRLQFQLTAARRRLEQNLRQS